MYAMRLGVDSSNASNFLNCSEICGVSLEGNIVGIEVVFAETTKISGVQCLMESSSAGQSQYGLVIDSCGNTLSFENSTFSGTCTAPIHATPGAGLSGPVKFDGVTAGNGFGTKVWDIPDDTSLYGLLSTVQVTFPG